MPKILSQIIGFTTKFFPADGAGPRAVMWEIPAPLVHDDPKYPDTKWAMRIRIMGIDQTYDYPVFACGPDWIEAVEHAASNIESLVPDLIDQVGGGVLGPEVVTTVPDTRMIRHVTTFTPANGSPPRDIELWIGDTHKDPEGEAWTSHIQVYGLDDDVDIRVPGTDWASAVLAGARALREILHERINAQGGGTLSPDICPPKGEGDGAPQP
jgi:hypothetical protein